MSLIEFDDVSYSYPLVERPALHHLSLAIEAGEFLLVVGASGSGKSTFLRAINGLVPHFYGGCFSGSVRVAGINTKVVEPRDLSGHVGVVFQDPEAQFVVDRVEDELVFAMENFGLPEATMRLRVEEVLDQLGIAHLRRRSVNTLSGGEKQRVAIASVLTLHPQILVLDEPTSQLDPLAAEEVLLALGRLNADLGLTIVIAEHRLERVVQHADRILYLPGTGEPAMIGPTRAILRELPLGPPVVEVGKRLNWQPLPLSIQEGRPFARAVTMPPAAPRRAPAPTARGRAPAVRVEHLDARYGERRVLRNVSLTIWPGEFVALVGRNGSGKTTLVKHLVGLLKAAPGRGRVLVNGEDVGRKDVQEICLTVGYVPQNPNALLFAETVYEELLVTLRNHGLDEATAPLAPQELLRRFGLAERAGVYPRDLSAGERERVALAAVLVTRPPIIILDEPTRGLDANQKETLMRSLRRWQAEGATILVVTHDVELVAQHADRTVLLADGEIAVDGPTREVLTGALAFAPQVTKLFGRPDLLTVADVMAALQ
ncbi:MAG TPA: energy-coupling factor transporter ATPase [Lacipirellulaceae bacterium]|nr:energy-coupling factor transporter ATPase [Lacipirellulaceae bacterium]